MASFYLYYYLYKGAIIMPIKAESPFVLSIQEGDSVFEGILHYAQFINLQSAIFTGIGALTDTTLGFYHRETQ